MNNESNGITQFTNETFGIVRTVTRNGEPWFVAKDVCDILQLTNPTMAMDGLEGFERAKFNLGRQGEANIISESGFYTLVLRSRKTIARQFRLWVTTEVLPQIRKTGGYISIESNDSSDVIMAKALKIADKTIQEKDSIIAEKNKIISKLEPQAQAYVDLMTAQGYLQFIDVAAMVEVGRNKLFEFLRRCKVLTKQSNYNVPYGRYTTNGMFKVITSKSESGHISSVTMVSPKGLNYIYTLMQKKNVLDKFDAATLLSKIQELEVA